MICISCRDKDHEHCLNFGVWETPEYATPVSDDFKRRVEPTNTWCDCQHDKKLDHRGNPKASAETDGYSHDVDTDRITGVSIHETDTVISNAATSRTIKSPVLGYNFGVTSSGDIIKDPDPDNF